MDTLKSAGPFTVFAPTDDAFAKLPKGTVEDLLKPENKAKLAGILTYHVVAGKVMSGDVVKLKEAATVNGAKVTIDASAGVKVDGATVTTVNADLKTGGLLIAGALTRSGDATVGLSLPGACRIGYCSDWLLGVRCVTGCQNGWHVTPGGCRVVTPNLGVSRVSLVWLRGPHYCSMLSSIESWRFDCKIT